MVSKPLIYDLSHVKGDSFLKPDLFTIEHDTLDFTGAIANFYVRLNGEDAFTFAPTETVDSEGRLVVSVEEETLDLVPTDYRWHLEVTLSDNSKYTWVSGLFVVLPDAPTEQLTPPGIESCVSCTEGGNLMISVNESNISLPPQDGRYYAYGYNATNVAFEWSPVTADADIANVVRSDTEGLTATQLTNMIALTQAAYDAIATKDANTFYVII